MRDFFDDNILLGGEESKVLYGEVKDLPIIDYHCHLDQKLIAANTAYVNLGQLWLAGDHYKWRAMRFLGVDEYYITGKASWKEKFLKYAETLPKLIGNPLYYWSHLELKNFFGINKPLNADSAEEIYAEANKKIKKYTITDILKHYKVEYIATTDNPYDDLIHHKNYDGVSVNPTFRPDKILSFDCEAIKQLAESSKISINSVADIKKALVICLDRFIQKSCKIADHGFIAFPKCYCNDTEAEQIFNRIRDIGSAEKDSVYGNLLVWLMREYKKRNMVVQLHFSVLRDVNSEMFRLLGADTGFDVMGDGCSVKSVCAFLEKFTNDERPPIILYSLNPEDTVKLSVLSGAFKNVYIGAAWWFNDSVEGIRRHLSVICEYACLGTNLGMLTDSRLFLSYSRFDFFRRILCSFVGGKVEKGEYYLPDAIKLVKDICYFNIKKLLDI